VKTYAHSLRLYQERLDDLTQRKLELRASVESKRLALLSLKKRQLAAASRIDPELERALQETLTRVQQYRRELQDPPDELAPSHLIQIGQQSQRKSAG